MLSRCNSGRYWKPLSNVSIIASLVAACVSIYFASNWWEKAYATHIDSVTSPDGCIRIDTYKPFWILPSMFHKSPHPDPESDIALGQPWGMAIFKRAYEVKTEELLGQTVMFDPVGPASFIEWGETSTPGRRVIWTNQFLLADTNRCADEETLSRLATFYDQEREKHRKLQEARQTEAESPEEK